MQEEAEVIASPPALSLEQHAQARLAEQLSDSPLRPHRCRHCSKVVLVFPNPKTRKFEDGIGKDDDSMYGSYKSDDGGEDVEKNGNGDEDRDGDGDDKNGGEPEYTKSNDPRTIRKFNIRIKDLTMQDIRSGLASKCQFYRDMRIRMRSSEDLEDSDKDQFYLEAYRHLHRNAHVYSAGGICSNDRDLLANQTEFGIFGDKYLSLPGWDFETWSSHNSPATDESFTLARNWLHNCLETHQDCSIPLESFVPSRLVEVPSSMNATFVKVVQTQGQYRPWCTLSYCWGGPQVMQTDTSNISSGSREIGLSALPSTILDAILVTRRLGISYIWIDSLCIVQDDSQDVERELAEMHLIYKNATVGISAASARTCNSGFLQGQLLFRNAHLGYPIRLRCMNEDGKEAFIILQRMANVKEPIRSRAWTMQEHILSPRILSYNSISLAWLCRSQSHLNYPTRALHRHTTEIPGGYEWETMDRRGSEFDEFRALLLWMRTVEVYCTSAVSFEHDRLSALSAVAEDFGQKTGWEYAAGLWKNNIHETLGWFINRDEEAKYNHRPKGYRAPSWTWASLEFLAGNQIDTYCPDFKHEVEINTTPAVDILPFGDLKSGFMKVNCVSIPATLVRDCEWDQIIVDGCPGISDTDVYLDAPSDDFNGWSEEECNSWEVRLLPFDPNARDGFLSCLILKTLSASQERYQRVGITQQYGDQEFRDLLRTKKESQEPRMHIIL